jgi:hypothetical protein
MSRAPYQLINFRAGKRPGLLHPGPLCALMSLEVQKAVGGSCSEAKR